MAVEYDISSDVAVIKETGSVSQCARVTQMYSGQITYDDEAGSKFATATINGKSQRVMLCIAVNGTVAYDDVPSLYSTVDGHRCLNIVTPTETGTPDDVPSLYETVVIDGQNVRAVRCIMINKTPVYDGVSSTCTFTGDDGKTHTAQLVNKVTGGSVQVIIKGTSPLVLPDAIANSLSYVKAFGGTGQRVIPDNYLQRQFIYMMDGSYIKVEDLPISAGYRVEFDFQTLTLSSPLRNYIGGRASGVSAGGGFRLSKLASSNNNRVVLYGFESGTEYYDPTTQFQANTRYKYTYNNGVCTLETGGSVVSTQTFTVTDNTSTNWGINTYTNGSTWQTDSDGIYVYSLKVWNPQGELVMDLVPAVQKGTVPVVGFYDMVSKTFKTATAGTFAAGGEAVPTPDTPMDIVSNNGVLKARHQSGLPWGYTLLDFVTNASGTRINTGIYDDIDDFSIEIRVEPSGGSWYICQSRANSGAPIYGLSGGSSGARIAMGVGLSGGSASSDISRDPSHIYTVIGSHKNGITTLYVKDETTGDEDTQTTTFDTNDFTAAPTAIGVWGQSSNTINANNDIYYLKIRKGGVLVADYVPCQYNGENGFYDFVSQRFLGALVGTINAGDPVSDPIEIYADGTVETINAHGKNLFNILTDDTGQGWYLTGTTVADSTANGTIVINCKPNTKYSFWHAEGSGGCRAFTMNKDTIAAGDTGVWATQSLTPTSNANTVITTYTTPADAKKLYIMGYRSGISGRTKADQLADLMVVEGEVATATAYQPYYNGGTATTEMLLKVDDYQDEHEILSGVVTRNVGVKVLDGTENWTYTNSRFRLNIQGYLVGSSIMATIISHYKLPAINAGSIANGEARFGKATPADTVSDSNMLIIHDDNYTDLNSYKTWLADQYAAGTPVIVVYPLATPTTESVTGQTLQVTDGDNVLEITQASLTGLELEAQYNAAVSLTIQEVQDANLDNNVTVTIQ